MNQAIEQVMAQAAGKPQRRRNTEISEATTVPPAETQIPVTTFSKRPGRTSKVSSGQDEGPREIGSARVLGIGSSYEKKSTGQAAKKK